MRSLQFARKTLLLLSIVLMPSVCAAQDWGEPWSDPRDRPPRVDLSVTAGMVSPTDWSDAVVLGSLSSISGALQQVLVRDMRVEPDTVVDAAVTYWRDRYGLRIQAGLSQSTLTIGGARFSENEDLSPTDIKTWLYEARGVIGLVDYSPERKAWPYVFLGLGGITYDLERTISPPLLTFIERTTTRREGDVVIVEEDGREFLLAVDELGRESVFAVSFGIGTDLRLPFGGGGIGLRLELSDHLSPSPLELRISELSSPGGLASDSRVDFGTVHHLRAAAGLVVQIGR
jgi:hypothetical protein